MATEMELVQQQMQALVLEVQRLGRENQELRAQQVQQAQAASTSTSTAAATTVPVDILQEMMSTMRALKESVKHDSGPRLPGGGLMDTKGLGKPTVFGNDQDKWSKWSRSFENFAVGIFGEEFRPLLEWAAESEQPLSKDEVERSFGEDADEADRIVSCGYKCSQMYLALVALTEDESQDVVTGAGHDHGAEAWRKLCKRWDPMVAGRSRAILKTIISPNRCTIHDLSAVWEKWEAQIRKYERRRADDGERCKLSQDLKMTAFESMLPEDLENHLILNKKRLFTYDLQKEEIQGILDSRVGSKIREPQIKADAKQRKSNDDPMDVDAFGKGLKGKGKEGKGKPFAGSPAGGYGTGSKGSISQFDGDCLNCGKYGHMARDCWQKSDQGSANFGSGSARGKYGGKSAGKGGKKGKKGKGKKGSRSPGVMAFGQGGDDWNDGSWPEDQGGDDQQWSGNDDWQGGNDDWQASGWKEPEKEPPDFRRWTCVYLSANRVVILHFVLLIRMGFGSR